MGTSERTETPARLDRLIQRHRQTVERRRSVSGVSLVSERTCGRLQPSRSEGSVHMSMGAPHGSVSINEDTGLRVDATLVFCLEPFLLEPEW